MTAAHRKRVSHTCIPMEFILLVLACFVFFRVVKPKGQLYEFDKANTLPLRGVLAIFIVFHHLTRFYNFSLLQTESVTLQNLSLNLFYNTGTCLVGVFFFLTGYGLGTSWSKKGNGYISGFLPRRLSTFLPEVLLLTILFIAFMIISGNMSFIDFVNDMKVGQTPLPGAWFIVCLVYVYIAFYLSVLMSKGNKKVTGALLILWCIVYIYVMRSVLCWGACWYYTIMGVPLGYFVLLYENRINRLISQRAGFAAIGLSFTLAALIMTVVFFITRRTPSEMLFIVMSYEVVVLFYLVIRLYGFPKWKILLWLGGISLDIYLVHICVIRAIVNSIINPYIMAVIVVLITCMVAYGITKIRRLIEHRKTTTNKR